MNFGLDYDGTITAEPTGFEAFIKTMRGLGHKVYITTMRYPSECVNDPAMAKWAKMVDGIIPTCREAKRDTVQKLANIKIDVWIDDFPEAVLLPARVIWPDPMSEGKVISPKHDGSEDKVEQINELVSNTEDKQATASVLISVEEAIKERYRKSFA